ncbi:Ig-like domain-containing protein [Halodesulfovibrio spirochaetisodalis]|uniref:Ig-like domain-containing protein n=1 Tax=Halodesulfovibrio spirochaetisodalis TaxID=1560234 RepID=UPI00082E7C91|nr:Ig-like domain-containing protein [Halodesulfovibrio spirochaetisodalis]
MRKLAIILCSMALLTASCLYSMAAFPPKVFAPYVDVCTWPTFSISEYQKNTSQKYTTLAFIVSDSSGNPSWGGYYPVADKFYLEEIEAVRKAGGDVIVSFGGASGTELALKHGNVAELQAAYQSVIDTYNLTWVDFDIEGAAVADRPSIDRRNKAIAGLQAANPELKVAFCLPVLPQGLTGQGLFVIQNAKQNGVRVDLVNVMAMDYGDYPAPNPEGQMGKYAIDAATNTHRQMIDIGVNTQIGITPMIGQNDIMSERFYLKDAQQLFEWAIAPAQLPWVGMLSMWSTGRDNGGCAGSLSATCSGITQDEFAFTKIFQKYAMDDTGNNFPTVAITSPANKTSLKAGADILVKATASDNDGTVGTVEFFLNGESQGSDASAPFEMLINDLTTGTHQLLAAATDDAGAVTKSAPVTVFVGNVCTYDAWQASKVYTSGNKVSFDGHQWEAKWWTQGNQPGTGGTWGVWKDLGTCGSSSAVTPPPTGETDETQTSGTETGSTQTGETQTGETQTGSEQQTGTTGCSVPAWQSAKVYVAGDQASFEDHLWKAKWWSQGTEPGSDGQWGAWEDLGVCSK